MSSKVLPPDQQPNSSRKIVWRKVGAQAGQSQAHLYAGTGAGGGQALASEQQLASLGREAEMRERRAHEEGFRNGELAASQKSELQIEHMMTRVAQSLDEMLAMRRQMRRQMEEDLVRLAIVVARRILHRELSVDPDALSGVVRAATAKIELRDLHRLRLSPADVPVLEKILPALNFPERVEVLADPALERGSVILETSRGILDSSVSVQLEEIESGFVDLVRRQS